MNSVTDASFQTEVLDASGSVLVDFWAEWCVKCKALMPSLVEIGEALGDRVKLVKLDIDANPDVPTRYGVRGIPTMILFRNGAPVATKIGGAPKSVLQAWLEAELNPETAADRP